MNPQWKIERDAFYADLFAQKGFDFIESAGFFYDSDNVNRDIEHSLDLLCTPIGFDIDSTRKSCVLLTTGSFCPMHFGHRDMLIKAKHYLEQNGWQVLKAYISPGHDEYIQKKCGDQWLSIDRRMQLIDTIIAEDHWLAIDPWEGIFNQVAVNFTDVIVRLQAYINQHLTISIPVFYVCGSDNARFAQTFTEKGHCVVVNRPGYESEFEKYKTLSSERILFVEGCASVSSSEIRQQQNFSASSRLSLDLVRQSHPLENPLLKLLEPYYSRVTSHLLENSVLIKNSIKPTISLDKTIQADYSLFISRLYDLGGTVFKRFVSRPESAAIDRQLELIPAGEYELWDTDKFSGKTIEFIIQLLQEINIKPICIQTLLERNTNEILDARDFFIDAADAGLVVQLPNGEITRAPYLFPYVNPAIRCSVEKALQFSVELWKMNRDYFKNRDDKLGQLTTNKALFLYSGFSEGDRLTDIADWHYQKLIAYGSNA
jgi:nicotinic acid mononucleotide adenylyltransferase